MRSFTLGVASLLALAACSSDVTSPTRLAPTSPAARATGSTTNRYIVVLNAAPSGGIAAVAPLVALQARASVVHVYSSGIVNGFAVDADAAALARLQADPRVQYVEADQVMSASAGGVETNAPWGLDRIDQHALPLNSTYAYPSTASNVRVYIVDTGILYGHPDFGGRATAGDDEITVGGGAVDCNGHGTHVSGTVGGTVYGVAKGVSLIGVRVLDCSGNGTTTTVMNGLNWVLQQKQNNPGVPMVVNMSLGGGASQTLDNAVTSLTNAGVTVVVAAGNSQHSACLDSPARAPSAITVAAAASNDAFSGWFSNFGSCVDIIAPGEGIVSDYLNNGTATLDGTSMASPHVAGAAALYLSVNPTALPAQVATALVGNATSNAVTSVPSGTANKLLYVGFLNGNQPPTASISAPANGSTFTPGSSVTFTGSATDPEDGALGGASLVWTSSINGQIGTGTTFSTSTLSTGTHTITLTATDSKGATGSTTRTITIGTVTAWSVAPNPATVAVGATLQMTGSGGGIPPGTVVIWKSDNTAVATVGQTSGIVTGIKAGTAHITGIAQKSPYPSAVATLTVTTAPTNQPPTAQITAPTNNTSVVQGTSITFTGTGTDPEDGALGGASLAWSSSINGALGTGTSLTTSTLSLGTHTITLTATDSKGATGTATVTLTITAPPNQPPTASISSPATNGTSVVQGTSVTFTGAATDPEDGALGGASLVWTSDRDGTIGTGTSFSTTTLSVGTHTVTLTATDSKGATGTATRTIVVTASSSGNQPPVAQFVVVWCNVYGGNHNCRLDGTSSTDDVGVTGWTWTVAGGATSATPTASSGVWTWKTAGTYNVTLTVRDAGGLTSTVTKAVVVP